MSDDLISRQSAIDEWKNDFKGYVNALNMPKDDYNGVMEYINELPSIDTEERKKATWVVDHECTFLLFPVYCSNCHRHGKPTDNYCPNCGSRMDAERKEL